MTGCNHTYDVPLEFTPGDYDTRVTQTGAIVAH
jgi:hypothetical protein